MTAVLLAMNCRNKDLITMLIENGADANAADKDVRNNLTCVPYTVNLSYMYII